MSISRSEPTSATDISRSTAVRFVVLLGLISLLADLTYEGARSITGPYLAVLGAGAATVGIVAGLGELAGYALRLVSGYLSDRTDRYWLIMFAGYGLNLLAVPLLALTHNWQWAAALIVLERVGKAVRAPVRDAMLSHATHAVGRGWGFGLHEAMDQIGALLGPLVMVAVLAATNSYRAGFAVLFVPALLALMVLFAGRLLYPHPREFEVRQISLESKGFPGPYWIYLVAAGLMAAGYIDFPLISYHFQKLSIASPEWIPVYYSVAMAVDAVAALVFGRLFDRHGIVVLVFSVVLAAMFVPLVFYGGFYAAFIGMALWGVGMGAQESVMRAAIAEMVPAERRGSAYGVFNMGFGVSWFLGSTLMGLLYGFSLPLLVAASILLQLLAAPVFLAARQRGRPGQAVPS